LDKKFARKNRIALAPLDKKIVPFNVDGTTNKSGIIEHCTWINLTIEKKKIPVRFLITDLGKETIILGLPWLEDYNPRIDWERRSMDISTIKPKISFGRIMRRTFDLSRMKIDPSPYEGPVFIQTGLDQPDEEEMDAQNLRSFLKGDNNEQKGEEHIWVQAKKSISQDLAQKLEAENPKHKVELPEALEEYQSVFDKKPSERLPLRKPWDHAIDLKPDFIPRDCKIYPMTPEEQVKLEEFVNDNLSKGYI